MEQNLQVGRQLDDKVLSNAIPDERAREPGIDECEGFILLPNNTTASALSSCREDQRKPWTLG